MQTYGKAARRCAALAVLTVLASVLSACASTGATFRSGVGDAYFEHAPYYAGRVVPPGLVITHVPITWQRGAVQPVTFDPDAAAGSAVAGLLAEMNAYLDSIGTSIRIPVAPSGTPPDVMFGCETTAGFDCEHTGRNRMRLAVGRPSVGWVESVAASAGVTGGGHVLVISLETGNYWPRQKSWRGDKEVELGTAHSVGLPWLTSLDDPVSTLQLTGALIDATGRAVRIGAEGLLARRTNLLLSAVGAQTLISDDDVRTVRSLRHETLPGQPLVWQVALRTLVAQLTGAGALSLR